MYYFKVSGGQKLGCSLVSCSVSPHKATNKVSRASVKTRLKWGRLCFYIHAFAGWHDSGELLDRRPQWLHGCWPEASLSSLPHGPLYSVAHSMVDYTIWGSKKKQRKSVSKREVTVFYSLLGSVLALLLHCIRYKQVSRSISYTGRGDYTRKWGSLGTTIEASYYYICVGGYILYRAQHTAINFVSKRQFLELFIPLFRSSFHLALYSFCLKEFL